MGAGATGRNRAEGIGWVVVLYWWKEIAKWKNDERKLTIGGRVLIVLICVASILLIFLALFAVIQDLWLNQYTSEEQPLTDILRLIGSFSIALLLGLMVTFHFVIYLFGILRKYRVADKGYFRVSAILMATNMVVIVLLLVQGIWSYSLTAWRLGFCKKVLYLCFIGETGAVW